ncbi:MAG: hypothetical protein A3J48_03135 [Candidatus Doudnabacteria bacterium RIFCSPHIGHO2_02_FULL_46_11]|uniref:Uncharacterized protein n=1 Tax=Candidatus Doudnabacteria bacterium RIFCSPHIGHO2_02_FULL_46_11 TaxID=1817832 RepID=A0A1F5P7V1_9BACT|nr:MAG: hypothetical protein A3J48_03135 [Candidatus Doudnabacteria bacterium RIFCSPHIGHO2_02_FULL_46_11]
MLDPIPIIFVLTALVGIVILIVRRLPDFREIKELPQPSWAKDLTFKSLLARIWSYLVLVFRQFSKAIFFAKSEFKNSQDLAKHLSKSVRSRFDRRRLEVKEQKYAPPVNENEADFNKDLARAQEMLERGEYMSAEETAINILKEDSAFRPAYEFLGTVYLTRKNWLEAAETYRYLMKQSPANDKYFRALGDAYFGLEDYSEAKTAYHRSLDLYATPEVFVSLGLTYQAMGDYNSATKAFESALDLEPENTQVLMLLAQTFINRQEMQSAQEVLEQILEIEPNNHLARERLMQLKI